MPQFEPMFNPSPIRSVALFANCTDSNGEMSNFSAVSVMFHMHSPRRRSGLDQLDANIKSYNNSSGWEELSITK